MGRKLYEILDYLNIRGTLPTLPITIDQDKDIVTFKFKHNETGNDTYFYEIYDNDQYFDNRLSQTNNGYRLVLGYHHELSIEADKTIAHELVINAVTNKTIFDNVEYDFTYSRPQTAPITIEFKGRDDWANSTLSFYGYSIEREGSLIVNLVPVKRLSDNALGLYDYNTKTFYTADIPMQAFSKDTPEYIVENDTPLRIGDQDATLLMGNTVAPLKGKNKKYKLLDYIQSSGTQYLLTTLKPKGTEHFKIKFTPLEWNSDNTNNVICGSRTSTNGIFVFGSIADQYGGGARLANFGYNAAISKPTLNVEHTVEYINEKMYYDGTEYIATNRQLLQINSPMSIFAGNTEGSVQAHTKMKLTSYEEYDTNGKLTHKWVPAQRVSDSVVGMYDIVARTFITNSGTGTFTYGSVVQDYIEEDVEQVEYVVGNGSPYINTGIKANGNTQWEVDLKFNEVSDSAQMGSRKSGTTQSRYDWGCYQSKWVVAIANNYILSSSNANTNRHKFEVNSNRATLKVDGTIVASLSGQLLSQESDNLLLLNRNFNGQAEYVSGAKANVYSSKITKDGVVVQDLIPCKVGSEYCMLDKVSGELQFNAGSGAFTGGNALPVTKIYKGTVRLQ